MGFIYLFVYSIGTSPVFLTWQLSVVHVKVQNIKNENSNNEKIYLILLSQSKSDCSVQIR